MTSKRAKLPSIGEVSALLDYDPHTGQLTWLVDRGGGVKAGDIAGSTIQRPHGYRLVSINDKLYKVHRICWLLYTGKDPGSLEIIHLNGDGSDNRWSNLKGVNTNIRRLRDAKQRSGDTAGVSKDSKSGKWRARLRLFGKSHSLGMYDTKEAAVQCVEQARKEILRQMERSADKRP